LETIGRVVIRCNAEPDSVPASSAFDSPVFVPWVDFGDFELIEWFWGIGDNAIEHVNCKPMAPKIVNDL
jgi:hypothetical protein